MTEACLTCWRKKENWVKQKACSDFSYWEVLQSVWDEEKEKKEEKAIRPCGVLKQKKETERAIFGQCVCVPEWAKTQRDIQPFWEVQSVWRNRKKHSESVSEWKRKMWHFSLLKLHTRKINLWSSHRIFEYYNHGKFEYLEEDFATGIVVKLYLLLKIYLLYIQFIMNTSLC